LEVGEDFGAEEDLGAEKDLEAGEDLGAEDEDTWVVNVNIR
jgi:hypothetical protein